MDVEEYGIGDDGSLCISQVNSLRGIELNMKDRIGLWINKLAFPSAGALERTAHSEYTEGLGFLPKVIHKGKYNQHYEAFVKGKGRRSVEHVAHSRPKGKELDVCEEMHVDYFGWSKTKFKGSDAEGVECSVMSMHGALGAFLFTCRATGTVHGQLVSRKAEFPEALDKTAMWARSNGYEIRNIKSDSAPEETAHPARMAAAEWGIILLPASPDEPREDGRAERAGAVIQNMATAMMANPAYIPMLLKSATP